MNKQNSPQVLSLRAEFFCEEYIFLRLTVIPGGVEKSYIAFALGIRSNLPILNLENRQAGQAPLLA
jgi:hypothetical protein